MNFQTDNRTTHHDMLTSPVSEYVRPDNGNGGVMRDSNLRVERQFQSPSPDQLIPQKVGRSARCPLYISIIAAKIGARSVISLCHLLFSLFSSLPPFQTIVSAVIISSDPSDADPPAALMNALSMYDLTSSCDCELRQ
jgi:hypothetical protein